MIPPDMRTGLAKFDGEAQQIVEAFCRTLDSQEPPPIIYHYTNDIGLKGVLETGRLWLTDIFNLNDPSELQHGFSHAVEALNRKAAVGPPESKIFAKRFESFKEGLPASAHYFVGSFSACGDDLGQWRAYADNGRGYALGFDGKLLEKAFTQKDGKPIPNNSTFHVTYKDAKIAEIHRQIIEKMFDLISMPHGRNMESGPLNAYMKELHILLALHTLRAALFFKHEAYDNEEEYRFLQIHRADVPPPEVKLRARNHSLAKYREFDWKTGTAGALKQIVIGPAVNQEKASKFVKDCLNLSHTGSVEILGSRIPYRAL